MQSFIMRTTKTLSKLCDEQADDLSLHWVHMSEGMFSNVTSRLTDTWEKTLRYMQTVKTQVNLCIHTV